MSITIAVPKETRPGELRVAITPTLVSRLIKLGATLKIQHNYISLRAQIYFNNHRQVTPIMK